MSVFLSKNLGGKALEIYTIAQICQRSLRLFRDLRSKNDMGISNLSQRRYVISSAVQYNLHRSIIMLIDIESLSLYISARKFVCFLTFLT